MSVHKQAADALRKQAKAIRWRGWGALLLLTALAAGLFVLIFGRSFGPLPVMVGTPPLSDKYYGLDQAVVHSAIIRLIEKVLATIVCIYLVQIVLMFLRYFLRLAEHLETCAALVELADGHPDKLAAYAGVVMSSSVELGHSPRSPLDSVAQTLAGTLREAIAKMPQR